MNAERTFLGLLDDIREKMHRDDYHLIKACGLLRQLLTEKHPLLSQVNKNYSAKIKFRTSPPMPVLPFMEDLEFGLTSILPIPGFKSVELNTNQFLDLIFIRDKSGSVSIRNVIQTCANAFGGIHFRENLSPDEESVKRFYDVDVSNMDDSSKKALSFVQYGIIQICQVVLTALAPLEQEVKQNLKIG